MKTTILGLKGRILTHGPNEERGFALCVGLVLAGGVIWLARSPLVHPDWVLAALAGWGLMWIIGPLTQAGAHGGVLRTEWFRLLPARPREVARAWLPSEFAGVGPLVTLIALAAIVVYAAPAGGLAVAVAVVAVAGQLAVLVLLSKTMVLLIGGVMRTRFGVEVAAFQMSLMLAIAFAGWIPFAAPVVPGPGQRGAPFDLLALAKSGLPAGVVDVLTWSPVGWGMGAARAAVAGDLGGAAVFLALLVVLAVALAALWRVLMVRRLSLPPSRPVAATGGGREPYLASILGRSPVGAVAARELITWRRDPARALELRHGLLTPALMGVIAGLSGWTWALPSVGALIAMFAAMASVNLYALDGTALWQTLLTPRAIRADVRGRQLAWGLLFAVPALVWTVVSLPLTGAWWAGPVAVGAAVAGLGVGAGMIVLLGVTMPAVGMDARHRTELGQRAGDPSGQQMLLWIAVGAACAAPSLLLLLVGGDPSSWLHQLVASALIAAAGVWLPGRIAIVRLTRGGDEFLLALRSGPATAAQKARDAWRKALTQARAKTS
ncbi:hypothetical protein [Bailinhaonella thermotolerans]|uniref:ABC-2 type transport system permease protein n=1 Tax=Bailinhaonella thermotolerans TaxID=1070861 RepID=A0A3A4A1L6_9ACTN|nr:hypothetical protein [Bailinhaonella thermotolerans]RJL22068.1 hypothetical protein D5H75_36340 [Bailinhaonella thermotolerans]